jgi:AcrR family transcriptional regulator
MLTEVQTRLRDEVQANKRDRILQEAVRLFHDRGFTGTTLDDVAAALGVTKPSIYTHFRSKTELLGAICQPTIQLSCDAIALAVGRGGSATDRLHRAMVEFTRVVLRHQPNMAVFFREEKHLSTETAATIEALRKRFDQLLSGLLAEGKANGEFHLEDPDITALALGGMICWIYTWYHADGRLSEDALCERMAIVALQSAGAHRLRRTETEAAA